MLDKYHRILYITNTIGNKANRSMEKGLKMSNFADLLTEFQELKRRCELAESQLETMILKSEATSELDGPYMHGLHEADVTLICSLILKGGSIPAITALRDASKYRIGLIEAKKIIDECLGIFGGYCTNSKETGVTNFMQYITPKNNA